MNGNDKSELFNLNDDLGEKNDLADKHPDLVKQMQEAHETWLKKMLKDVEKVSG